MISMLGGRKCVVIFTLFPSKDVLRLFVFRLLQYNHTGLAEVLYFSSLLVALDESNKVSCNQSVQGQSYNKNLNFKFDQVSKNKK